MKNRLKKSFLISTLIISGCSSTVTIRQSPLEKSSAFLKLFSHRWKVAVSLTFYWYTLAKELRLKCSRRYRFTEVIALNTFTLIFGQKIHGCLILDTFCDHPQL